MLSICDQVRYVAKSKVCSRDRQLNINYGINFDAWHRSYSLNMHGVEAKKHFSALKDFHISRGMGKTIPPSRKSGCFARLQFCAEGDIRRRVSTLQHIEESADKPRHHCAVVAKEINGFTQTFKLLLLVLIRWQVSGYDTGQDHKVTI